jgi:hypothetical protein
MCTLVLFKVLSQKMSFTPILTKATELMYRAED